MMERVEMAVDVQWFVGLMEGSGMEWMMGKCLLMRKSGLRGNGMTTLYL
jgi:hypothetical protein